MPNCRIIWPELEVDIICNYKDLDCPTKNRENLIGMLSVVTNRGPIVRFDSFR
jgi:hypothetical protein